MTDKQIKLDGRCIPIEQAIKAGLISEKDIDVPSKRLDRIDKMEIDLANYERMERDIEKIIEPYQLDWELDCLSLPSAIQSILERKEQECEELKKIINEAKNSKLDLNSFFAIEAIVGEYQLELDQLKEQLEAYKMEADEGKEINAELKAENDKYSLFIEKLCDYAGLECDSEEQAMRTLSDLASQMNKARWIIDRYKQTLAETKEIAEPYQKDIDKICGNCRRYDGCHACCMDTLNNYEYRTGTTKACDKFIELKDFDINKLANQILQKISEVLND